MTECHSVPWRVQLRVLVSAMLSGRKAHVNYNAASDGCQVFSVSIGGF